MVHQVIGYSLKSLKVIPVVNISGCKKAQFPKKGISVTGDSTYSWLCYRPVYWLTASRTHCSSDFCFPINVIVKHWNEITGFIFSLHLGFWLCLILVWSLYGNLPCSRGYVQIGRNEMVTARNYCFAKLNFIGSDFGSSQAYVRYDAVESLLYILVKQNSFWAFSIRFTIPYFYPHRKPGKPSCLSHNWNSKK